MQQKAFSNEPQISNLARRMDFRHNVRNLNNVKSPDFNQQLNCKFNNTETKFRNKPHSIQTILQQMSKPSHFNKQTIFTPAENKLERQDQNSISPHSRPPLSPRQQSLIKNHFQSNTSPQQPTSINESLNLGIDSANNSPKNNGKKQEKIQKKQGFPEPQSVNELDGENFLFSMALNQKMVTLQNKSNRLIQKVIAIQEQIQKYAEVQQKQLRPIGHQAPSSPLLQTKSLLNKKIEKQEFDPVQVQHQQNIRKMNIMGKNKAKMIQNLEIQIQHLQQKALDPQQKQTQDIEEQKKQIDNKFINYYKHKNDILKQSKSQKFSFKHLKYLTKQNKYDKSDCGDQIMEAVQGKQNDQNLETQLKKLKEQFSSYQQRTSKQLENYKDRLNQNILEKEILKKQLQRQKYEHLKEKIFNKNKPMKTSRMVSPQKTSRDFIEAKLGQRTSRQFANTNFAFDLKYQQEKPQNQVQQSIDELMNLPKVEIPEKNEEPQFEDLEQFKDEVSMRYIEQNEQIQGLHEKIKQMDEIIEDLRDKLEKGHSNFIAETEELKELLEQKQTTLAELSEINQGNLKEIDDLKNEINDMKNYLFHWKEENQQQNEQIQEYKNVIQEFVEQVKNLRNQLGQKNSITDQLYQHIQEAQKINRLCENQINQLEQENESFKKQIDKLLNQLKLKEAKERYSEALLQKQKNRQTADNSLISELSQKNKIQSSQLSNQTIRDLKQQNQQKLDVQRIQLDKVLKEKDSRIQQLEENLDQLKNQISHKVDQQVSEGIRTFLRYRKHTNHLSHEIFKVVVHGKKIYSGNQFKNVQFDINFKDIKIESSKNTKVIACKTDRSEGHHLSLRKLIDARLNSKLSSLKPDDLPFKLQISLKLIQFGIQLIQHQGSSQQRSSRNIKSSKKLPTLDPEGIYAVQISQMLSQKQEGEKADSELSIQQRMQMLEKNFKSYQLIYLMESKKETQSKKDKHLIYLSPQVLLSKNESETSYCWTLGIIIDEIFNNKPYYSKIDQIVTRKDNYKYQGSSYPEKIESSLKDILEKMVRKNLKQRPSLNATYESFTKIMALI